MSHESTRFSTPLTTERTYQKSKPIDQRPGECKSKNKSSVSATKMGAMKVLFLLQAMGAMKAIQCKNNGCHSQMDQRQEKEEGKSDEHIFT